MYHNIIFIGGIHGAGKGPVCASIGEKIDLVYLSSSEVLKWSEISDLNNKQVYDISYTQNRLIKGLKELINSEKNYLLDGHFCLLDSAGLVQKIPLSTFISISPILIAVVIEDIKIVQNRLKNRDGKIYDIKVLNDLQNTEINHAIKISELLEIPFYEIQNNRTADLVEFLSDKNLK